MGLQVWSFLFSDCCSETQNSVRKKIIPSKPNQNAILLSSSLVDNKNHIDYTTAAEISVRKNAVKNSRKPFTMHFVLVVRFESRTIHRERYSATFQEKPEYEVTHPPYPLPPPLPQYPPRSKVTRHAKHAHLDSQRTETLASLSFHTRHKTVPKNHHQIVFPLSCRLTKIHTSNIQQNRLFCPGSAFS